MVSLKIAAAFTALTLPMASAARCRCLPGDDCWPSSATWQKFNETVNGRLISPKPTGWVCYEGGDPVACAELKKKHYHSYYRADRPGSMQNWHWEEGFSDDGRCLMEKPEGATCNQGNVPIFGVEVKEVADIQDAVKFAAKHNLRLTIKTSGHDFQGRSTAPGSFLIWTHNFKNLAINEAFVPQGSDAAPIPAITITGGVAWGEVYNYVKANAPQYSIIGGHSTTVGATGGYALGGGHGALSPAFGLAVDNILEVQIVTADGKLRNVNSSQEPQLFWALRGGGGGTFGVVVSITYKLHKTPASFAGELLILTPTNGTFTQEAMENIMTIFAQETPNLDKKRFGGYFSLNPGMFWGTFIAPTDYFSALATFDPMVKGMRGLAGVRTTNYTIPFTQFADWRNFVGNLASPETGTDYTGKRSVVSSRLIPEYALSNPRKLAQEMMAVTNANVPANGFIGHLVNGLGVRENDPTGQLTSVTPAWRQSVWHALWFSGWTPGTNSSTILERKNKLNKAVQIMRDAYPDSGSYLNEADYDEPKWQQSFWGNENYVKLLKVKARYDPKGLFVCHQCVGSEIWGEDGNCKSIQNLFPNVEWAKDAIRELNAGDL